MRGLFLIPVMIIGIVVAAHWFLSQDDLPGNLFGQGSIFSKGKFFSQEKPPSRKAVLTTTTPGMDFSGLWMDEKTSALLRLRQTRGSLSGEYAPPGDRAALCRFRGKAEGDSARFDLKVQGQLYHCSLEREGDTAVLYGRKDMDALLNAYGQDSKMPNGALLITPRSAEQRIEDRKRLSRKREEIKKAVAPVVLGTFELVETKGE
jgi:hypothetical protein